MASGIAYRWMHPHTEALHHRSERVSYKAPPNKATRLKRRSRPLCSRLPLEILHLILLKLDLPSLGMLRRVDTTTRRLVESLPLMHDVKCSNICIGQLFTEFCHPRCRSCSYFGPYLYLPAIRRSCYRCDHFRHSYRVAGVADLCLQFGLTQNQIKSLSTLQSRVKPHQRPVDLTLAKALGREIHGSHMAMEQAFKRRLNERKESYEKRRKQWEIKGGRGSKSPPPHRRPHPISLFTNPEAASHFRRMNAAIAFPYWDRSHSEPRARFLGSGWHTHFPSKDACYRAFLVSDLPKHFQHCAAAKAMWKSKFRAARYRGMDVVDFIVGSKTTTRP
ncbi:hypothetical protein BO71DRAFT_473673 [Aspergillus ellipticus CBS 707.79]|uniref:F-box domain-containing protein n=1 Tax=Aspergillus ellipticus CBS 707.79 TaxID=1448320 RepID=A0A319DE86_9EURO|nr:hypothetical protein BO71DRAFT_473673 [Aspergillus ellipticus CBS 707.79]